jgi:hypothetical protein
MRLKRCVLRMNQKRISKIMKMKGRGNYPTVRLRSRWEDQDRKDITQTKGRTWKETEEELWKTKDR